MLGPPARASSTWLHRLTGDINGTLMTVAVVAGLLFAVLSVLVVMHPAPFFFDRPIEVAVQSVNAGPFDWFNAFVSAFSGFVGIGVGAGVIAITFLVRRRATLLVAFSAIYAAVYNIVNIIVSRPRPTGVAHTTSKLIGLQLSQRARRLLCVAERARHGPAGSQAPPTALHRVLVSRGGARVAAAALSRIYVGAHWPSDVVGGLLVGVAWTCLSLSLGRLTRPVFARARPEAT